MRSQECESGPAVSWQSGLCSIRYDYETEGGFDWAEIVFEGAVACRFLEAAACDAELVKAYDKLPEINDSEWVAAINAQHRYLRQSLRHYRIFFDDAGCVEVAATSVRLPPLR